jgi:heme/copper-type cytochrome/quinol oxidase subunit 2
VKRLATTALALFAAGTAAHACSACYGRSEDALAHGMNMGILFLLVVLLGVLGGITAFFIYLIRRAGRSAAPPASSPTPH